MLGIQVDGGWPLEKQIARVAVVDENGATLLDEYATPRNALASQNVGTYSRTTNTPTSRRRRFVMPDRPVVDYLTQYSGITEKLLATARYSFHEIRERVLTLIQKAAGSTRTEGAGSECALVGHSLECDLHALRISIPTSCRIPRLVYDNPYGCWHPSWS